MTSDFVVHEGSTAMPKSRLEELAFQAMHDKLHGMPTLLRLRLYYTGATAYHRPELILDDIFQGRDSHLNLICHTTMDREIGEYYCFDMSGDAGDPVPFKVYDGTAIRALLEELSADPVWLGLVGLIANRYATPNSDLL